MTHHAGTDCACHHEWDQTIDGLTQGFRTGVRNRGACSLRFSRELFDRLRTAPGFGAVGLDRTAEAFAILPRYENIFSNAQIVRARQRLVNAGFDVGAHILGDVPREWDCPTDCPERL